MQVELVDDEIGQMFYPSQQPHPQMFLIRMSFLCLPGVWYVWLAGCGCGAAAITNCVFSNFFPLLIGRPNRL